MRVLIGCEYSGVGRRAFTANGWKAYSCDILAAEDGERKFHIQEDIRSVIKSSLKFDLFIAHPPCTRLANSGVRWLAVPPPGRTVLQMQKELRAGASLFSSVLNAPYTHVCIENPVMHKHAKTLIKNYTPPTQSVQPWQFGHGEIKRTCLWLKNLPVLIPTKVVEGRVARVHLMGPSDNRGLERSRSYEGMLQAMAVQWRINGLGSGGRNSAQ